jgi:CHAD domain-containing protein
LAKAEALRQGVPFPLADAVMKVESGYDPSALGEAGEIGLMQGVLATQTWAGDQDHGSSVTGDRVNLLTVQPFVFYNLPDGWYVASLPQITADWTVPGDKWTVPIGGGIGRVFPVGDKATSPSLETFERTARAIARCVGNLRDADVLVSTIFAPIETTTSNKTGFVELEDALVRHRQLTREHVNTALLGSEWTRLHLYLLLWPHVLREVSKAGQPIRKYARSTLQKRWKRTAKLGRKLDQLSPKERHEMRKSMKHLRYVAEFFSSVFPKRDTRRFIKQLKQLQDIGYLNDVQLATQLHSISEAHGKPRALTAANYVIGRHDAEAEHVWRGPVKAWKRLKTSPRFWK